MLFDGTDILEIGKNEEVFKINCNLRNFKSKDKPYEKTVLDRYIRNKRFKKKIFIMCGEEIYIKKLTVPNLDGNTLEKTIKDEMKFYYRVSEEIVFSYHILKENKNNLDLLIFYIQSERLEKLNIKTLYNIKAIYMVQFLYIEYINKIIGYKNYLLAFIHDKHFYLIYCENKMLKANAVQYDFRGDEIQFEKHIIDFCKINNISNRLIEKLILVGIKLIMMNSLKTEYNIENLGQLEKTQIYAALI